MNILGFVRQVGDITNRVVLKENLYKEVIKMPSTLKEAIDSIKSLQGRKETGRKASEELLGKYKGIIPTEKTSSEFIKELRYSSFDKVKD
ncbi:MAG: hypothetical protein HQK88_15815 [Nitrospirae bacterium]|nr:hypothetical protein [Nitrospirota bacterium]MBF0536327.1 hypothetical protein [Nitrospirota bacterium]MBF0618268.1 hypothetical protein [Nitrospirota bacterium]